MEYVGKLVTAQLELIDTDGLKYLGLGLIEIDDKGNQKILSRSYPNVSPQLILGCILRKEEHVLRLMEDDGIGYEELTCRLIQADKEDQLLRTKDNFLTISLN